MAIMHHGEPADWPELFRQKRLHVVCVASGGLTTCDFCASTIGGMTQEDQVWPLTKRVNDLGETGTFWPILPLTVVPQPYWKDRRSGEGLNTVLQKFGLAEFYKKSFREVAEAQRLHVRLADVFVDLNGYGARYDFEDAATIAVNLLSGEDSVVNLWFARKQT